MAIKHLLVPSCHSIFGTDKQLEIFVGELCCPAYGLREYYEYSASCLFCTFYNRETIELKIRLMIHQLKGQEFESCEVLQKRVFDLFRENFIGDPDYPRPSIRFKNLTPLSIINELEKVYLLLADSNELVTKYISLKKMSRQDQKAAKEELLEIFKHLYNCNRNQTASVLLGIIKYLEFMYKDKGSYSVLIVNLFRRVEWWIRFDLLG